MGMDKSSFGKSHVMLMYTLFAILFICQSPHVNANCYGIFHDAESALSACNAVNPGCRIYHNNQNCGGDHLVESVCPRSIAPNGYCGTAYFNESSLDKDKNLGERKCTETSGNPIVHGTGNKYQVETDITSRVNGLPFERYYNSQGSLAAHKFGKNWSASYFQFLDITSGVVNLYQADGKKVSLLCLSGEGACKLDQDLAFQFEKTSSGYLKTSFNNEIEEYDNNGRLVSITNNSKYTRTLIYNLGITEGGDGDPDTLDKVTNGSGRWLSFQYDVNGRVSTLTESSGKVHRYGYGLGGMLQYVSYPDNTLTQSGPNPFGEDNTFRQYHYENISFPAALTRITDEHSNRFAAWTYDTSGFAISSQHEGGADRVTVDYANIEDAADPRVVVSNALGKSTTFHYTTILGVRKIIQIEGHQSSNCAAASKNYSYYPNGQVQTKTDWKNNTTSYQYNTRNLESSRTEALGTPQEITITTEWHPTFNLRTKVTEPGRETNFTYDVEGRLLSQSSNELPLQ